MKAYPQYKPAGTGWIKEIPYNWKVERLKFFSEIILGKMLTSEDKGGYYLKPYLRAKNLNWLEVNVNDIKEMWFSESELEQYRLSKDDLLVSEGGEVGRTCIWNNELIECYIQNSVNRVRIKDNNFPRYFLYQFFAAGQKGHFDAIVNQVSIAHLTKEKLADIRFVVPTFEEQKIIAEYLDQKTAAIDDIISKKQRLIELLQEERAAVINTAVTQGLNPDAPRKPSGIPWLGDIPAHWKIMRLKHISPVQTVGVVVNPSQYISDEGVPFIYGADISIGNIDIQNSRRIAQSDSQKLYKTMLSTGDLVTVRVGYPGVTAVVPPELDGGNCASVMITRRSNKFVSEWFAYAFNSRIGEAQIEMVEYGAAQKQFNISHAVDFRFPFPPKSEQNAIAVYLNEKTYQFARRISQIENQIALLREYRSTLISQAVTGKIDVRQELAYA